jgi:hypothetical protein
LVTVGEGSRLPLSIRLEKDEDSVRRSLLSWPACEICSAMLERRVQRIGLGRILRGGDVGRHLRHVDPVPTPSEVSSWAPIEALSVVVVDVVLVVELVVVMDVRTSDVRVT